MDSVEQNIARRIIGIIGNIIAVCLFLSPAPTFVRIVKNKSVEEYSAVPYLATLINCMFWILYGLPTVHPNSTLVITINGAGTAIEIAFLLIFFTFCSRKQRFIIIAVVVAEVAFVITLATLVMTLLHTTQTRTLAVGIVCCVFNVMMYASPLSVMKMVIKTKSVEFMPFLISLASFTNGITWTVYAFMPFDPFIVVPNGIGSILGLAQLMLYGAYYKSTKRIMEERERKFGNGEVDLSTAAAYTHTEKINYGQLPVNGV